MLYPPIGHIVQGKKFLQCTDCKEIRSVVSNKISNKRCRQCHIAYSKKIFWSMHYAKVTK